jgi:hypothetical protein
VSRADLLPIVHKELLRDSLILGAKLPENLAQIGSNQSSSAVVRENLSDIHSWARENLGSVWELHNHLGIKPKTYRKQTGQKYQKTDPRRLARAIWTPPGEPDDIAKKLRKDLKQKNVPKSPSAFFASEKFQNWLKENNFHDLRDFTEFFGVPLLTSFDGTRKQTRLDLESLVPEIWPSEAVAKIYDEIKKLSPQRPANLQNYFVASNKKLMKLINKLGFNTMIDFFRYTGVVIKDRRQESGVQKDPVIDFQKLASKIWTKPRKSEVISKLKEEVQKQRPSDARTFFNSKPFRDWLAANGFSKLSEFARFLGASVTLVKYKSKPKLKIDYQDMIDKIWAKADTETLSLLVKEDLNQSIRPAKPKDFFTSLEFKNWLKENNFESLVSFGEAFKVKLAKRVSMDKSRGKVRKKITREVDYDGLAKKIWTVPNLRKIRSAMFELKTSPDLQDLKSPYRFFNSKTFREWLQENNFRDLVHFCEKIKIPTSRTQVADRTTGKVSYDWQAMVRKLGLEDTFV